MSTYIRKIVSGHLIIYLFLKKENYGWKVLTKVLIVIFNYVIYILLG